MNSKRSIKYYYSKVTIGMMAGGGGGWPFPTMIL